MGAFRQFVAWHNAGVIEHLDMILNCPVVIFGAHDSQLVFEDLLHDVDRSPTFQIFLQVVSAFLCHAFGELVCLSGKVVLRAEMRVTSLCWVVSSPI